MNKITLFKGDVADTIGQRFFQNIAQLNILFKMPEENVLRFDDRKYLSSEKMIYLWPKILNTGIALGTLSVLKTLKKFPALEKLKTFPKS